MGLILDLLFVVIIIITAILSAKKGFIRTLLELVGFAAAIIIALTVSEPISDFAYEKLVEPAIIEKTEGIIVENTNAIRENLWEKLPSIIKDNSEFFGINEDSFLNIISSESKNGAADLSIAISEKIVRPAVVNLFSTIISFILILILIPLFRLLAKGINKLFSVSVVGKVNKFLGAILGILKGLAICLIVCILLDLIVKLSSGGFWLITNDFLDNSFIFSKIFKLIFLK